MESYTSLQRVLKTLGHEEADKAPLFLLFSHYGAKELGMTIKEYFSNPTNILEAQLVLNRKYKTDCLYAFQYASIETEAFGGTTQFYSDAPPNAKDLPIKDLKDISKIQLPKITAS